MAKDMTISMLYDFYGELLTEKQQEVIELYYNEDLSLAEIASHSGISRQGVRDSIKRAEVQLLEFEERLELAKRFQQIKVLADKVATAAIQIEKSNSKYHNLPDITECARNIVNISKEIAQL